MLRATQRGRVGRPSQEGTDLEVLNGSLLGHTATLPDKLWLSSDGDSERVRIIAEDRKAFQPPPQAGMWGRPLPGKVCDGDSQPEREPAAWHLLRKITILFRNAIF